MGNSLPHPLSDEEAVGPWAMSSETIEGEQEQVSVTSDRDAENFDLRSFFPYHARLYYKHVTDAVFAVYGHDYGMKPYEWRTLAILGHGSGLTPNEIVSRSSMDKVSVSRAVSGLRQRNWLVERMSRRDGRSKTVRLSQSGLAVYDDLVVKLRAVEQELLSVLDPMEVQELMRLMAKVRRADTHENVSL